jgi:hypothetical protein
MQANKQSLRLLFPGNTIIFLHCFTKGNKKLGPLNKSDKLPLINEESFINPNYSFMRGFGMALHGACPQIKSQP